MKKDYSLGLYEKAMPSGMAFRDMLAACRDCGFDRMEISIDESKERRERLNWTAEQRRELRAASNGEGVPITTMCLSGHRSTPLGSHDPAVRAEGMALMERAIALSEDIGIRLIQLAGYDVYYEQGDEYTRNMFAENLRKCVDMAAASGIMLGFETMETPFMDTVAKAMTYVNDVGSPFLGVYPDIGNLKNASLVHGHDLVQDIKAGAGHIFAAHLKETRPGIYRNMSFGEGHTEYMPCLRELIAQGVRLFTGEFWYLGEENYKNTLINSASFLRSRIEGALAEVKNA